MPEQSFQEPGFEVQHMVSSCYRLSALIQWHKTLNTEAKRSEVEEGGRILYTHTQWGQEKYT